MGCSPAGGCVVLGSRTIPKARNSYCLAKPKRARRALYGHDPTLPETQPSLAKGLVQISRLQVCLLLRSPFPCSLLTTSCSRKDPP